MKILVCFDYAFKKEGLVFGGGLALREGHEVNLGFLYIRIVMAF